MPNQTVRGRWNPWYWMRRRLGCRLLRREALGATTVSKRTQDGALIWSTRRGGPGDAFQHNCDGRRIRVSASSEPASSGKGWLLRPKATRRIAPIFTIAHLPYGQIQSSSALDHSDLASFRLNSWAAGLRSAGSKGGVETGALIGSVHGVHRTNSCAVRPHCRLGFRRRFHAEMNTSGLLPCREPTDARCSRLEWVRTRECNTIDLIDVVCNQLAHRQLSASAKALKKEKKEKGRGDHSPSFRELTLEVAPAREPLQLSDGVFLACVIHSRVPRAIRHDLTGYGPGLRSATLLPPSALLRLRPILVWFKRTLTPSRP